ncbi:MAG: PD40 domain-containing protein [Acidobacteria bacterium]|nr:PD40 domain-containing protein [Acidobacteriota bacterium]
MKVIKSEHNTHFYAFDSFIVDTAKSVLFEGDRVVSLTPKAFELLLVLVQRPGSVLKKEELLELVWANTFVDENNLPRTVSALRKALGEEPTEHKYIMTVPGQGYRFVADVREVETQDAETGPPLTERLNHSTIQPNPAADVNRDAVSKPAKARYRTTLLIAGAVLLALGATAVVYLAFRQSGLSTRLSPQRKLWQLTFEPGLEVEPAWSPDGRFVAFSSDQSGNFDIWVRSVGEGNSIQVTKSAAHDWQPDWSPDGLSLVFRSERDDGGLYIVPALGGNERKLCGFGYRPRWSPDGSQILFYNSAFPGVAKSKIYVIGANGGNPQEVLTDFASEFAFPLRVAWHPDGRHISVWGNHLRFGWSFWTVSVTDGGALQSQVDSRVTAQLREAAITFGDFVWLPSGKGLIFEGEALGVKNLWKITVDPQTMHWVDGPERLTIGAGNDTDVVVSPDGRKAAFSIRNERSRLWTLPFDPVSGRVSGTGQPITGSSVSALQPGLSPDGKLLVFRKQRGSKEELWAKSLDDGKETLLAPADDFSRTNPIWSHDSSQLIYIRTNPSKLGQTEIAPQLDRALALRALGGSDEQVITSSMHGKLSPTDWTPDGKFILASSDWRTPERVALCLFSLDAAPNAETQMQIIASHPDYNLWQGRFSPDGRWISFNAYKAADGAASTIYVVPASGGSWIPITEGKYWNDKPRWSPDGRTIYFVSNRTGFFNVWKVRFDPSSGKPLDQPTRVTDFESPTQMIMPYIVPMEMVLTREKLILPMMETSGGIWILENID